MGAEPSNSWTLAGRGSRISTSVAPDRAKSNGSHGDSTVFGQTSRAGPGQTIWQAGGLVGAKVRIQLTGTQIILNWTGTG